MTEEPEGDRVCVLRERGRHGRDLNSSVTAQTLLNNQPVMHLGLSNAHATIFSTHSRLFSLVSKAARHHSQAVLTHRPSSLTGRPHAQTLFNL